MTRSAAPLFFLGLLSFVAVTPTIAEPIAPDSSAAAASMAPASTTAQPGTPDSSAAAETESPVSPAPATSQPVTVILKDGTERPYARVEPGPGGFVRAHRSDGTSDTIAVNDIAKIVATVPPRAKTEKAGVSGPPRFRGRPYPERTRFYLLQAGIMARLDSHEEDQAGAVFGMDLGTMKNRSPKVALGGSLGFVTDEDYARVAIKPRIRRWLSRTVSIDFAPGVFLPIDMGGSSVEHGSVGFVGETSLILGDWAALTGQVEVVGIERSHYASGLLLTTQTETDVSYYFGAKAGGTLATLPVAALMLLGILSESGSDY